MTKQKEQLRGSMNFSKAEAIKEIEKLLKSGNATLLENGSYAFTIQFGTVVFIDKDSIWCNSVMWTIPIRILKPLSKLIPILFKEGE